jgi:hypothetical protein
VARIGEKRNTCRVLVGKPERKGPLGIPRPIWKDIKLDSQEEDVRV